MTTRCLHQWALLVPLLFLVACEPTPRTGSSSSDAPPDHPLDQMVLAFEGNHSRAEIKDRMDEAMGLYGVALTEENYSRAGSTVVSLRREYGPSEMEILDYMIRSHAPGVNMEFPSMAGIAAAALVSGLP